MTAIEAMESSHGSNRSHDGDQFLEFGSHRWSPARAALPTLPQVEFIPQLPIRRNFFRKAWPHLAPARPPLRHKRIKFALNLTVNFTLDMQPLYSYRLSTVAEERRGELPSVVALRSIAAAAFAVAWVAACAAVEWARADEAPNPSLLLFSGTDIWHYGAFLYGGFIWSPAGLNAEGFTFKMLLDGGNYSYVSSSLQDNVDGTKLSAAALPGWRFSRGGLTATLFAGPLVQDYRLEPADPGSRLHGFYVGAESAAEIWYQPNANTMAALDGAIASIGPTGYVRAAIGFRLFERAFVGPEFGEFWCADFQEIELGAHVTGLRIDSLEWSMGGGFALTSDQRTGPYVRLGVSARY